MRFADQPDDPPLAGTAGRRATVLAVLGDPAALSHRAVAVVGGRNASANGQTWQTLFP